MAQRVGIVQKLFSRPAIMLLAVFTLSNLVLFLTPIATERAIAASYTYFDTTYVDSASCKAAGGEWIRREGTSQGDCSLTSTPSDNIKQYMWSAWFAQCFRERAAIRGFSADEITSIDFGTDTDMNFGYASSGDDDGVYECKTSNVQAALSALGFNQGFLAFLDYMGCKVPSNEPTARECGNLVIGADWSNIMNKLLANRYNSSPPIDNATKYQFYLESFVKGCGARSVANPTPEQKNDADSKNNTSKYAWVTVYNPSTNTMEKTVFSIGNDLDKGRLVEPVMNEQLRSQLATTPGSVDITCGTLAAKTSQTDLAGAYLLWANTHQVQAKKAFDTITLLGKPTVGEGKSTCAVGGIGWIICPVMNFLSSLMDRIMEFLGEHFLKTDPELFQANDKNGTYVAWKIFRNYANIAFILVFLIIIFSQISSVGISNYGLKRMLPRLIIAAILVNISYFICQAAVDLSNFIGFATSSLFDGIVSQVNNAAPGGTTDTGSWESTIGSVLLVGAGLALALALGILVPALLAALMIIVILLVRKALIVLLIVISPLAFVAYLLPNTEQWFKKWYSMLLKLLMVFPIIAAVFGGSKLASAVINAAGASTINGTTGEDDAKWSLQLIALGVTVVPFFVVPGLLKGAVAASGALGAKLQGWGNKATGRVGNKAGGKAKQTWNNSSYMRGKQIRESGREQYKRSKFAQRIQEGGVRARLARGVAITPGARKGQEVLGSTAAAQAEKDFNEELSAANTRLQTQSWDERMSMASTGKRLDGSSISEADRVAAIQHVMKNGNGADRQKMIHAAGSLGTRESNPENARARQALSQGYLDSGMNGVYGAGVADKILSGMSDDPTKGTVEEQFDKAALDNLKQGKLKAETIVGDAHLSSYIADVTEAGKISGELDKDQLDGIRNTVQAIGSTPQLAQQAARGEMTDTMKRFRAI